VKILRRRCARRRFRTKLGRGHADCGCSRTSPPCRAGWASGSAITAPNLSPALLGVGYIVGLNVGILVLIGGMVSWNVAIPIYAAFFLDAPIHSSRRPFAAGSAEDARLRHLVARRSAYLAWAPCSSGGVWALISIRESLLSGIPQRTCGRARRRRVARSRTPSRPADDRGSASWSARCSSPCRCSPCTRPSWATSREPCR